MRFNTARKVVQELEHQLQRRIIYSGSGYDGSTPRVNTENGMELLGLKLADLKYG